MKSQKPISAKSYRFHILEIIEELGGRATTKPIKKELQSRLRNRFSVADRLSLGASDTKWWNNARWARDAMVKCDWLNEKDEKGVWEISPQGRQILERARAAMDRADGIRRFRNSNSVMTECENLRGLARIGQASLESYLQQHEEEERRFVWRIQSDLERTHLLHVSL